MDHVPPPLAVSDRNLPFDSPRFSDSDFEDMCAQLFGRELNIRFAKYGRPGDSQRGIDLLSDPVSGKSYAVQCKKVTSFVPSDLKLEIAKLRELPHPISTLFFALGCPASTGVRDVCASELSTAVTQTGPISSIQVWDRGDLARAFERHPDLVSSFFGLEWRNHLFPQFAAPGNNKPTSKRPGAGPSLNFRLAGRDGIIEIIRQRLLFGRRSVHEQTALALKGWPGIGKTTLAAALYHDKLLEPAFDNILWTSVGQTTVGNRTISQRAFAQWFEDLGLTPEKKRTNEEVLKTYLREHAMLLLIDDIWDSETAKFFRVGGPATALVITTRSQEVAQDFASGERDVIPVPPLDSHAGMGLLSDFCSWAVANHRTVCERVLDKVEHLPLAIVVVGKQLQYECTHGRASRAGEMLVEMSTDTKSVLTTEISSSSLVAELGGNTTIADVLRKSIKYLKPKTKRRFADLEAFQAETRFSVGAVSAVWNSSEEEAQPTLDELVDRGLVEAVGETKFRTHALLLKLAELLKAEQ